MIRRLRQILVTLSLLAAICSALFWAHSYRCDEMVTRTWNPVVHPGRLDSDGAFYSSYTISRLLVIYSSPGRFGIGISDCDWYYPGFFLRTISGDATNSTVFDMTGPHWARRSFIPNFSIAMSYAVSTAFFATLPILMIVASRYKRRRRGFPILEKTTPASST